MSEELKPGDYCHYAPAWGAKENGRVKEIGTDHAFVVFKCAGEWDRYDDFTGQKVDITDLKPGWHKETPPAN